MLDVEAEVHSQGAFETPCGDLCTGLTISGDLSESLDDLEFTAGLWNTNCVGLSRPDADDARDMSIRIQEFGLLKDLHNGVVTAHTAIDIWFSIDNNAWEECRYSRGSANGLPYRAVGRCIFWGMISAKKTGDSGVHVQR